MKTAKQDLLAAQLVTPAGRAKLQAAGCMPVPPAPELKEKMNKELEKLRKRDIVMSNTITFKREEHVGLDDGLIYPGNLFPLGTSASVARGAGAERAPLTGVVRVIVVLVNFTDKAIGQPAKHFSDLFFSLGVIGTGSVREYYREVSHNIIDIQGEVVGPVTLSHPMSYYAHGASGTGGTLPNARTMAQEAAQLANPTTNFGVYDNDGDGYVDAYIVIHAGSGGEVTGNVNDIWSHKWVLPSPYAADGKTIYAYLTVPEDCRTGVCAHELGHLLFGFPDLYDSDYSSEGIGNWCLMSGGSWNGGGNRPAHPSAWCKAKQGWVSVVNQTTNATVSIQDVKSGYKVYRLWKNGAAGTEYFLVENRQKTGFDDNLPAGGLLIWHIDDAVTSNTNEAHYQVALIQADNKKDLELNHNRGDGGDPYPGSANNHTFNGSSSPNSNSYAGVSTCVGVTSISAPGATMTAALQVKCKVIVKEFKDGKEIKEKDIKDKEIAKENKDLHKDVKETIKDIHPDKTLISDKATANDKTVISDKSLVHEKGVAGEKGLVEHKLGDNKLGDNKLGEGGGGLHPSVEGRLNQLEHRLNTLEPFIGRSLRPDLSTGAYSQEDDAAAQNPELGPHAKRSMDTKAPDMPQ
ncbi:M6 family metalloprotease domain-containing protein [Hymenobacter jejuensis]|uniref:M6 family metalloprotease domain-containing protein n=1 Tax=Hymenobacter jejuensis TaxID=2502781 RepID=A0A5B8A1L3_9BACT|nr:M6 family metalloprotease domain-containing protein [Hymenobacter jejuensis]QDA61178.1 M6 family metalloprotease domain-containing protein [Hymenobacter jejuensis]